MFKLFYLVLVINGSSPDLVWVESPGIYKESTCIKIGTFAAKNTDAITGFNCTKVDDGLQTRK